MNKNDSDLDEDHVVTMRTDRKEKAKTVPIESIS